MVPDLSTAKVLLAGILADTILLKSPNTTGLDVLSVEKLAPLAGVSEYRTFGKAMFEKVDGLGTRDPEQVILEDMKTYRENGLVIGISQCEVPTLDDLAEYSSKYMEALEKTRKANNMDWALLMITDVMKYRSILISSGHKLEKRLSNESVADHVFDMKDAVSRKTQLLPEIIFAVNG